MTVLDKLERRIGFIAVPGLIRILIGFAALVFVLIQLSPDYAQVLNLDPAAIRRGQVWRLFTYIFLPPTSSPIWIIFALWFLWFIGEGIERAWGAFRLTLYFIVGMIGTTVAAFIFGSNFSNGMLLASLFYAFARFYPDEILYIFFILPVKVKWLALISFAFLLFGFISGPNSYRMAVLAALGNYLIFFGPEIFYEAKQRKEISNRRQRFEMKARDPDEPLHRCKTCGATEQTDANLEFRVARDGDEYCLEHLPSAVNANSAS